MPGGDFPVDGVEDLEKRLRDRYPFVDEAFAHRLVRHYGTESFELLGEARRFEELGRSFGFNLTEAEVRWLDGKGMGPDGRGCGLAPHQTRSPADSRGNRGARRLDGGARTARNKHGSRRALVRSGPASPERKKVRRP
ncbi:MAG: hypothetical protein R3C97_15900 [Geminicoccaceae bacterium]